MAKLEQKDDGKHVLRLGYTCDFEARPVEIKKIDSQVQDGAAIDNEVMSRRINDLAKYAGGDLRFVGKSLCVFELYTVISELRPGQSLSEIKLAKATKKPDWDRFEMLASNNPSLQAFGTKAVITEYKRFLALKLTHKDESSEQFAPSPIVDKAWHLHLVFPEQYQQDVLAFAKELKVDAFVMPHCPFLADESKARYQATYNRINDKKLEKIVGKKADMAFWPTVEEVFPEYEEDPMGGCC